MTVKEVQRRVSAIERKSWDDEAAHSLEDALHQDVLAAIARGSTQADKLAKAALATQELDFARWCA